MYNVVLVSAVQQSDLVIHIYSFFFRTFFSIMVYHWILSIGASQMAPVVKNLPARAGDVRDMGSVPGSGRSPGRGHGNPPQYSSLENPMGRGAFLATVHGVTKSQTQLKWFSTHIHIEYTLCHTVGLCCLSILYMWKLISATPNSTPSFLHSPARWQSPACCLCPWLCSCFTHRLICAVF